MHANTGPDTHRQHTQTAHTHTHTHTHTALDRQTYTLPDTQDHTHSHSKDCNTLRCMYTHKHRHIKERFGGAAHLLALLTLSQLKQRPRLSSCSRMHWILLRERR